MVDGLGQGPGNSTQRNYLPAPYSDFIYSIICEEYGLLGGGVIIGLYLLLFFRVTKLITQSPKSLWGNGSTRIKFIDGRSSIFSYRY